jgi:DNA polymerase III delta prime subunit
LHNYEQLDYETQNKIASKIDRTINSAYFWITCKNIAKLTRKLYNKINIVTIPVPNFNNIKLYLNKFLNKMNIKMFEPVLDKIIQISEGDIYKAVLYIEIFQIDRNIINRNLLDNDIDKIINCITDESFIEKGYYEMRELAFQCLEKTDMINVIYKLLNTIIYSDNFTEKHKKKIIYDIADLQNKEKPNCKGIYILEAILSRLIMIYHNNDTDINNTSNSQDIITI